MRTIHPSVRNWLWLGIFMILVQILLGGITRLTGSGLSITEWNVFKGIIPPITEAQWQQAFDEYKQIPQYAVLNSHYTLADFKSIFLWEYTHRLWARSIGFVFIFPFIFFLVKKRIPRALMPKLVIAFVLGGLQGLVGWVMVKSGLSERIWVDPLNLTAHLIAAVILLTYMLSIAWQASIPADTRLTDPAMKRFAFFLLAGLLLQITFGGLMAGTHAATYFPTWPSMNGQAVPGNMFVQSPFWVNLVNNITTIQFFHRGIAYILFFAVVVFALRLLRRQGQDSMARTFGRLLIGMVSMQVLLGIVTLLGSAGGHIPVLWGVLHQSVGLLLFSAAFCCYLYLRPQEAVIVPEKEDEVEVAALN